MRPHFPGKQVKLRDEALHGMSERGARPREGGSEREGSGEGSLNPSG